MKQVAVFLGDNGWPLKTIDFEGVNPEPTWRVMSMHEYNNYCRKLQGLPPDGHDELTVEASEVKESLPVEEPKLEHTSEPEIKRGRGRPRKMVVGVSPDSGGDAA